MSSEIVIRDNLSIHCGDVYLQGRVDRISNGAFREGESRGLGYDEVGKDEEDGKERQRKAAGKARPGNKTMAHRNIRRNKRWL